jgi:site-specific recombinase XerD
MPAEKPTTRQLKPETVLANFSRYLYGQCGFSNTTVNNYVSTIKRLAPILSLHPTARKADALIAQMRKDGLSHSHQRNTSLALERFGDFIHVKIKLARSREPHPLVQATLSEAEVSRILGATQTVREKAILSLLAYSGIRNGELCNARVIDLDTTEQLLRIHGTKPVKDRAVVVPSPCLSILVDYLKDRNPKPKDWMFTTVRNGNQLQTQDLRKLVRVAAERAGIKRRVHPHLFRHSLATNLLGRGTGVLAIKEQMGHVHLGTTMRYLHSTPGRLQEEYRMHIPSYL